MSPAPAIEAAQYRLRADKRGYDKRGEDLYRNQQRYDDLPEQPKSLPDVVGTHAHVSEVASKLNESQLRNSFLDYLYSPDLVG